MILRDIDNFFRWSESIRILWRKKKKKIEEHWRLTDVSQTWDQ